MNLIEMTSRIKNKNIKTWSEEKQKSIKEKSLVAKRQVISL